MYDDFLSVCFFFFFFNDTATTEIYTLSLHDALPIRVPAGLHAGSRASIPTVSRRSSVPLAVIVQIEPGPKGAGVRQNAILLPAAFQAGPSSCWSRVAVSRCRSPPGVGGLSIGTFIRRRTRHAGLPHRSHLWVC